ncbi:MAG: alginate lyase family protein [Pyrinomonadaceae bacterium]
MKKLKGRSWSELRVRGKQTIAAYSEQMGISGGLPTDDSFRKLFTKTYRQKGIESPQLLLEAAIEIGNERFFPSFPLDVSEEDLFIDTFGRASVEYFIAQAKKIVEEKFDLLGFNSLEFKDPLDWHYEPISEIDSPMQHWKLFDELDANESGDKKIIWELNRQQHFFSLGVAYLYTHDEEYASCFARHLKGWMDQNPPGYGVNWVSSLEVSFRAMSWIWAFRLFAGSQTLSPGLFQEALKFLFVHASHVEQYLSTYYSPNTHLTGEALGLYYLGTQFPFFERAKEWRKIGRKILLDELDTQIFDDGVYFEQSTWYQRYTLDFYLHFFLLAERNGDMVPDSAREKLEKSFEYLMYITRPDGTTPLIGDDDGGRMLPRTNSDSNDFRGSLAVAAVVFSRGDFKYVAKLPSQELFWLMGSDGIEEFRRLEEFYPEKNSRYFKDGGYFVMRDGWSPTDNYLLFDAGEVGSFSGGHGHADVLSFELASGGKTLLVDPGTYTYHKSENLRESFRSSNAHNVLTIDSRSSSESSGKFSWSQRAEPSVRSWISLDRFDYVEGSHDGYMRLEDDAAAQSRSILFLRNEYWIMRDFINTMGSHTYQQNIHFASGTNPTIVKRRDGSEFVSEADALGNGLSLFAYGDKGKWHQREGWVSTLFGRRETAPFFQFISQGKGPQEFFTFMLPRERGFHEPGVIETDVPGGRAFVINFSSYQDLFVYSDPEDEIVRTEIFDTNFRFCWARLSAGDELPEEFVMLDGTSFSLDNRVIINEPEPLRFAIARRFGKKLYVRTNKGIFSVSLPSKSGSSSYIVKTPPY